ncbi:MAG TPA: hypothetical protein VGJ26_14455 [Pirellulales bacterium]
MTVPSMKSPWLRVSAGRESARGWLIMTIAVLGLGCLPLSAQGQTPWDLTPSVDQPVEGRLYNLTNEPFEYRLHRSNGVVWTSPYTIPAGGHRVIAAPTTGKSDILGVRGDGKGYVIIQYSSFGGKVTVRLPARDPSNNKLEPNWFCVKDINGFRRLIQAANEETAKKVQADLLDPTKSKPLTAVEIKDLKKSLRANWVLSDEGNPELTFRR